ncbi:hypothetical protein [Methanotorris igneus]|uniref:hypothetical protein n=1 Tax=Methanotorris igneus TaxID=2189 RepID=UPI0006894EE7|nr:hypothetical protein [Methanotorris igneus]
MSDIVAIVPHGVFEFAGFALAIVLGIESANHILPIINQKNRKNKFILIAMLLLSLTFIGVAAFIEPFDWLIYSYAKNNGISVLEAMIMAYRNLISYFLGI